MRHAALTSPPRLSPLSPPPAPAHREDDDREAVPRESLTRLIAAHNVEASLVASPGLVAHNRPTTPVPSDYMFLSQHRPDEVYAAVLAGRLEGLADETLEPGERPHAGEDGQQWSFEDFDEITQTRIKTVIPDGNSSPPAPLGSGGMFSLLASVGLVPFLRQAPRDIPRGTIDHGQACVLALIDGRSSIEQLLDTSPMPVPRVLRILNQLLESGVVGLK